MAGTVWTTCRSPVAMLPLGLAALLPLAALGAPAGAPPAGDIWTTPGRHSLPGAAGADLPYTLVHLPDVRLPADDVSVGRFDRVALAASPQLLVDRANGPAAEMAVGYPGGIAVRLSAGLVFHDRAVPARAGLAFAGDAYDVFLAVFTSRRAADMSSSPLADAAADPRGIVVRADRPTAALALLAGL